MSVVRPASVRVLVDEAHQQAWSIRPDVAARMQPAHPGDSSYAKAAETLRRRDFIVEPLSEGRVTPEVLEGVSLLVLPHASHPKFEATTGIGSAHYDADETAAIHSYVEAGGGLVILAESEQDKYDSNLGDVAASFGIAVQHSTVQDYQRHHQAPSWVVAQSSRRDTPCCPASTSWSSTALVLWTQAARAGRAWPQRCWPGRAQPRRPPGPRCWPSQPRDAGASWSLPTQISSATTASMPSTTPDCGPTWPTGPPFRPSPRRSTTPRQLRRADPSWSALKAATEELRTLQAADATIDLALTPVTEVTDIAARVATALDGLAPHFPHQTEYLKQTVTDLSSWIEDGCGKPNFGPALSLFRPELQRANGVEHLAFFPMYTPNGSLDVRFEALIVRVPWPEWIAELEATEFANDKFVPVHLVDNTAGYDSECAVFFPETDQRHRRGRQHLRRHLLRPRGRPLPARRRRSRADHRARRCRRRSLPCSPASR